MKLKYRRILMYLFASLVALFPLLRPVFTKGCSKPGDLFYLLWFMCLMAMYAMHKSNRCPNCKKKLDYKKREKCPRCGEKLDL